MSGRGVLYCVWGDNCTALLERSIASLQASNPGVPYVVHRLPDGSTLLDKPALGAASPFDTTVFLDADTVVLGDIAPLFEWADRYELCARICEAPNLLRYGKRFGGIEYNTGVLGWRRGCKVMDEWLRLAKLPGNEGGILWPRGNGVVGYMERNDQLAFALAVQAWDRTIFAFPHNYNLRPRWDKVVHGEVIIWHDTSPVPSTMIDWNKSQREAGSLLGFCGIGL